MNYEKNIEFIKYYVEDVLIDLKPMILSLSKEKISIDRPYTVKKYIECINYNVSIEFEEQHIKIENVPKYTNEEIYEIFMKHINVIEYVKFCRILKIGWDEIFLWAYFPYNKTTDFEDKYKNNCETYFRDQRRYLKNQERKNRRKFNIEQLK